MNLEELSLVEKSTASEVGQKNEKVRGKENLEAGFALGSDELEKLVMAKEKLNGIVSLTNSLKQFHNWD